jgi:hypothetical protein
VQYIIKTDNDEMGQSAPLLQLAGFPIQAGKSGLSSLLGYG